MSYASAAEPIEMLFRGQTHASLKNHILDGHPCTPREGALLSFEGDMCRKVVTYILHSLFACRRWRMCLPSACGG